MSTYLLLSESQIGLADEHGKNLYRTTLHSDDTTLPAPLINTLQGLNLRAVWLPETWRPGRARTSALQQDLPVSQTQPYHANFPNAWRLLQAQFAHLPIIFGWRPTAQNPLNWLVLEDRDSVLFLLAQARTLFTLRAFPQGLSEQEINELLIQSARPFAQAPQTLPKVPFPSPWLDASPWVGQWSREPSLNDPITPRNHYPVLIAAVTGAALGITSAISGFALIWPTFHKIMIPHQFNQSNKNLTKLIDIDRQYLSINNWNSWKQLATWLADHPSIALEQIQWVQEARYQRYRLVGQVQALSAQDGLHIWQQALDHSPFPAAIEQAPFYSEDGTLHADRHGISGQPGFTVHLSPVSANE